MKRGQFALEFVILVSFAIFFAAVFLVIMQKNYAESKLIKEEEQVNQLMRIISSEVSLAESSPAGYERKFYLPTNIEGNEYNISSTDGVDVVFDYNGRLFVFFLANSSLDEDHCNIVIDEKHQCLLKTGYNTIKKTCSAYPSNYCKLTLLQN